MHVIVQIPQGAFVGEWAVIELQGDLESRDSSSLHGQFIGDLHYTDKGKPLLIIGHHILQGEQVTLDKPFAILERKITKDLQEVKGQNVDFIVKALVKKKLVFSDRPKPIIANVPKIIGL